MAKKTDPSAEGETADILPQPDDDAADDTARADAPERAEPEEASKAADKPAAPEVDDPRAVAARAYREMRDKRLAEAATPPAPEANDEPAAEDEPPAKEDAPAPKRRTVSLDEIDPDAEVVLKVDGREIKRPFKDIVASAQIDAAANTRLEEAKRILSEAKAEAQAPRTSEHPPTGDDKETASKQPSQSRATEEPEHQPDDEVDSEKLASIVERIQVGDRDEGQQALAEFVKMVVAKPKLGQQDISREVQQVLSERETMSEIDRAVQGFAKEFPNLVSDDDLTNVTLTVITKELVKDLQGAGMSDGDLASAAKDTKRLAAMHRQARLNGAKLRTYDGLLSDVGKHVSEKFGIRPGSAPAKSSETPPAQPTRAPTDSAKAQERIDRKRAAPQQPRTAGGRTPVAEAPKPKTRAQVVEEMKRARGFRT